LGGWSNVSEVTAALVGLEIGGGDWFGMRWGLGFDKLREWRLDYDSISISLINDGYD